MANGPSCPAKQGFHRQGAADFPADSKENHAVASGVTNNNTTTNNIKISTSHLVGDFFLPSTRILEKSVSDSLSSAKSLSSFSKADLRFDGQKQTLVRVEKVRERPNSGCIDCNDNDLSL